MNSLPSMGISTFCFITTFWSLWGPHNLVSSGFRKCVLLSGGKDNQIVKLTTHFHPVPWLNHNKTTHTELYMWIMGRKNLPLYSITYLSHIMRITTDLMTLWCIQHNTFPQFGSAVQLKTYVVCLFILKVSIHFKSTQQSGHYIFQVFTISKSTLNNWCQLICCFQIPATLGVIR